MTVFLMILAIQVGGALVFVLLAKCFNVLVDDHQRPKTAELQPPKDDRQLVRRIAAAHPTAS